MTTNALAKRDESALAAWTPSFAVSVDEAVAQVQAKHDFFRRVMRENDHYGKIPGAGDKPVLLKSGAELLLSNMGLQKELSDADVPTVDYGSAEKEGLIRYRRVCRIYRQTGPGIEDRMLVAQAEGSCSSRESKYRWRESKRKCPVCSAEAIIKGKAEYGGGWLCFKKQNGCGAKFKTGDEAIEGQTTGRIPNPDLGDIENTVLKMADKRAFVAATLLATGCSDIFTQDVGDHDTDAPRSDDIEAEYVETSAGPIYADAALVAEIKVLALDLLGGSEADLIVACRAVSDGVTENVDHLSQSQAEKLHRVLGNKLKKREAASEAPLEAGDPGAEIPF